MTEATRISPESPLNRVRIVILDADAFSAGYIASSLERAGAQVVGPYASVSLTIAALENGETPGAAVIAANAMPRAGAALLRLLSARSVPFVLLTEASGGHWLDGLRAAPMVRRPFAAYQIAECVAGLMAITDQRESASAAA